MDKEEKKGKRRGSTAILALLLLILSLAPAVFADQSADPNEPFFSPATSSGSARQPTEMVLTQLNIIFSIIVPLMLLMVVLAAAVYVGGQFFGAETRARAVVWSQGMLVAVGVSAAVLVMTYFILPGVMQGQVQTISITDLIGHVKDLAEKSLAAVVVVSLVLAALVYAIGQVTGAETRARATAWATGLLTAAVFSALIYAVFLQVLPSLQATFGSTGLFRYSGVILTIVMFIAILALLVFILSRFFKVPEWEAYLNIEISNLANSFLLVVLILAMFVAARVIATAYTYSFASTLPGAETNSVYGNVERTLPQAAIIYIRTTLVDSVLRQTYDVYSVQACTSVLSTFSRRIGEYVLSHTYKVFPGIDTFVSISNVLAIGLVAAYGSLSAQVGLLQIVDGTMELLVLPAGLLLRFIPPTRDAGAFLIAVAFGFQIIFPAAFLINGEIYNEIGGRSYPGSAQTVGYLCGAFSFGLWGFLLNPEANPVFSTTAVGRAVGGFLSQVVSESVVQSSQMSFFIPLLKHVASLSLLAIFMPALAMVVTIAFINAMTKFIVAKV